MIDRDGIRPRYEALQSFLDERGRRLWASAEAKAAGYGGIAAVAQVTGLAPSTIGRGFVKGFGLRRGAIASSVGHDSHNICVVGADDADMAAAVNRLVAIRGGFAVVSEGEVRADPGQSHMALVVEDGGCWGRRGWTLNADSALRPCHGRIRRLLCRGR